MTTATLRITHLTVAAALIAATAVGVRAQQAVLKPVEHGEVTPEKPLTYFTTLKAGDVVSGNLQLVRGGPTGFRAFDPSGAMLKDGDIDEPGTMRVGFAAPVAGTYRVEIYRAHPEPGDDPLGVFGLSTEALAPVARMTGVHAEPVVRYESARIKQLARDVQSGPADALPQFWTEAKARGGPIVEPMPPGTENVLVTFLWRETYDTRNVLVVWPPAQSAARDFYMTKLPGTDVWYKSVRVHRSSRFGYSLAPNDRATDRGLTAQRDPLRAPRAEENDWSLFELPGAPDESAALGTPPSRGTIVERTFTSVLLKGSRPLRIYTPPGYDPSRGPYPLLLIFDGITYANAGGSGFKAPENLDNLIADGRIRPAVACFLSSPGTRPQDMNVQWQNFADAMATELIPWLRSSYAVSANPRDVIVGGYSAGGRGAALIALRHSEVFGNVLSQSGVFGAPMASASGPTEAAAISRLYIAAPKFPIRFFIDVGLYEQNNGDLPADEAALTESMVVGNRHFRDVLEAKGYDVTYVEVGAAHNNLHFRSTLTMGLLTLLGTQAK